jgi:hypothetical protein
MNESRNSRGTAGEVKQLSQVPGFRRTRHVRFDESTRRPIQCTITVRLRRGQAGVGCRPARPAAHGDTLPRRPREGSTNTPCLPGRAGHIACANGVSTRGWTIWYTDERQPHPERQRKGSRERPPGSSARGSRCRLRDIPTRTVLSYGYDKGAFGNYSCRKNAMRTIAEPGATGRTGRIFVQEAVRRGQQKREANR